MDNSNRTGKSGKEPRQYYKYKTEKLKRTRGSKHGNERQYAIVRSMIIPDIKGKRETAEHIQRISNQETKESK
jgi:hypothetical protein